MWIRLRDSGDWTWVDQEVATWTNWAPDEPANVGIDWHNKRTEYADNIRSTLSFFRKIKFDNDESYFPINLIPLVFF